MVKAEWSGSYPCLCHGVWTLVVNGKNVSEFIPEDLRGSSMGTHGTYSSWHFEDSIEVFEDYESGFDCEEWIVENKNWLELISSDERICEEIYYAINANDFRSDSCGGCI